MREKAEPAVFAMLAQKPALTIGEACQLASIGLGTLYKAIGEKKLKARKQGRRTIILRTDLDAWMQAWPEFDAE